MNQNNIYIPFNNLSEHIKDLDSIVLSDWNNSLKFHGSVLSILLTFLCDKPFLGFLGAIKPGFC